MTQRQQLDDRPVAAPQADAVRGLTDQVPNAPRPRSANVGPSVAPGDVATRVLLAIPSLWRRITLLAWDSLASPARTAACAPSSSGRVTHAGRYRVVGIGADMVLNDIRDECVLQAVFEMHRPQVVFRAAALENLPMLGRFPRRAGANGATCAVRWGLRSSARARSSGSGTSVPAESRRATCCSQSTRTPEAARSRARRRVRVRA